MNLKNYRKGAVALILTILSGVLVAQPVEQAATNQNTASVTQRPLISSGSTYVIGDGDVLGINVWNEPAFNHSIPVRSDGKISLPLIGDVLAAGKTPSELENAIAAKLRAYITQPAVTVMVLQIKSRNFNILGRVAKPGSYPLAGKTTVLDAIAEAGGFLEFAKRKDIYILRQNPDGEEMRLRFNYKKVIRGKDAKQNVVLEPHDTIVVP